MYRAMIVDDETVSQEYLKGLIRWEAYGFELTKAAYSAAEAKEILAGEKVDLVILDISMPGESGVSLSSFIARQYPAVLMLAVSSHDDYDYVRQVLKNGAQDYILKHRMNAETLVSALNGLRTRLDGKGEQEEKHGKRSSLHKWLFMKGEYPYLSAEGACAVGIAHIPELTNMHGDLKRNLVSGILSMIENNGQGIADVTAVFHEPDIFVSFYLFANTVSQNKMLGAMFLCSQKNRESLKQVFKLDYFPGDYPLITDYRSMPMHLAYAVANTGKSSLPGTQARPVSLSLNNKRRFIAALEEANYAEAEYQIGQAYSGVRPDDLSLCLSLTNEFLDMLLSAAGESRQNVDFSKSEILDWAGSHSPEEIADKLERLAAGVLDRHAGTPAAVSPYVKAALDIIRESYAKELSQDGVAVQLGLSPSYFSKLFKQETGSSFTETLNRHRVNAAKTCLKNGESIKEASCNCGFKYYNYFITVFKNYTGQTPAEYLKEK